MTKRVFPIILLALAVTCWAETKEKVIFSFNLKNGNLPNAGLIAQCKGAFQEIATQRPRGVFLDFEADEEITRNPKNFMDEVHYRAPVARLIEAQVASALSIPTVAK